MVVVGIDEVGRGCWAGPLVAGAVVLAQPIEGLADSKKLSKQRREKLDATIRVQAVAYGLGWVWPAELDAMGMTAAVTVAMRRAFAQLTDHSVQPAYDDIVIDGNLNFLHNVLPQSRCLIRADALVPAVSAASIVAKVARDAYMVKAALRYPNYGFEHNVGYGTAVHNAALSAYGICELHRQSFAPVRAYVEQS